MVKLERKSVTFDVDEFLSSKVEALSAEGWQVESGKKPQITYELARIVTEDPPSMGVGRLVLDDSKIMVIKAGE